MSGTSQTAQARARAKAMGALLLGTGLAFASLILIPALAARLGLGPSLTGALRIALMKASHRAAGKAASRGGAGAPPGCPDCR